MRPNEIGAWRRWLTIGRLVPLVTILFATAVGISVLFGKLLLSTTEGVVITMLGLLAVNALTERLSFLEKIEAKLAFLPGKNLLNSRSELPSLDEAARAATEIRILSVSGITLIPSNLSFFKKRLSEGCVIKFILLNPESDSLPGWRRIIGGKFNASQDIHTSLEYLAMLGKNLDGKSDVEVRLSPTLMPFSLLLFDPDKSTGWAIVEYYGYRVAFDRPHVVLRFNEDREWFTNYKQQFDELWNRSTKIMPVFTQEPIEDITAEPIDSTDVQVRR